MKVPPWWANFHGSTAGAVPFLFPISLRPFSCLALALGTVLGSSRPFTRHPVVAAGT